MDEFLEEADTIRQDPTSGELAAVRGRLASRAQTASDWPPAPPSPAAPAGRRAAIIRAITESKLY